ncbi:septal ring lytic transglycosylase RlpA family protein [Nocardiopsis nanhaiensis]
MGKHEPEFPPADGHHEPTEAATVPVGPRLAAARSRKKRALVVASAAGLTLAVGGTAAAAVITTGGDPQDATSAASTPQAEPETLVVEEPQESEEQDGEADGDEDSPVADPQSLSASGSDILEEPEEEEEPETSSDDSEGSGDSGGGSGEGGTCEASFYGEGFHGSTTANGETFDTQAMTAAHKTLPFDTMVEVTNPNNGSSVTVRINDRGPYIDGRCLDLSTAAFDEIIGTGSGVGQVDWEVVG